MPLPTEVLRQRLAEQPWTAHNIRLNPEVFTLPGQPELTGEGTRFDIILRTLLLLYGEVAALRVADLGCLEGGFAWALAQHGASVIGVEARAHNLAKCALLKEHFELSNLEFVLGDVKDFARAKFGEFDVVLALGILYHLDQPVSWLSQVADATKGVLVIDTHYAPQDDAGLAQLLPAIAYLGPLERVEVNGWGYEGRSFFEYPEDVNPESQLWASYSNRSSFWLTKESLLLGLRRAGFDFIFEQHDWTMSRYHYCTVEYPRALFFALKSACFIKSS